MDILICDDHKIVRDGLRQILNQLPGNITITDVSNGKDALDLLSYSIFDIVLMDISLPDKSGLEVLQLIKENYPTTNVMILSMHDQEQYTIRAIKHGASGYLTKDTDSGELLDAVTRVAKGGSYFSHSLAETMARHLDKNTHDQSHKALSIREFEILIKLANGKSLLEIGAELRISHKTVSTYRKRIMIKMDFTSNSEITKL